MRVSITTTIPGISMLLESYQVAQGDISSTNLRISHSLVNSLYEDMKNQSVNLIDNFSFH